VAVVVPSGEELAAEKNCAKPWVIAIRSSNVRVARQLCEISGPNVRDGE